MLASSSQQLLMEQINELAASGENKEAVANLQRLFDGSSGRIVQHGGVQTAGTLQLRSHIPVRGWAQRRLTALLLANDRLRSEYQLSTKDSGEAAFLDVSKSKDLSQARAAADRFASSQAGPELGMLLADLYLERGWGIAAVQALSRISSDLRVQVPGCPETETLPWPLVFHKLKPKFSEDEKNRRELVTWLEESLSRELVSGQMAGSVLGEASKRLLLASEVAPECLDRLTIRNWIRFLLPLLDEGSRKATEGFLADVAGWTNGLGPGGKEVKTFGGGNARIQRYAARFSPTSRPRWSQQFDRYTANRDSTDASQPRVGESVRGILPYYPTVVNDRVYVNAFSKVWAFDLGNGRRWPDTPTGIPLFNGALGADTEMPSNYPLLGVTRSSLAYSQGHLYARMGEPVTGWANGEKAADGGSRSYLVGLDLAREGSVLRGFPLRLTPPDFSGVEFEGPPMIWDDWLIVATVSRDNVGVQRRLIAFDRLDGKVVWESDVLAAGGIQGSDHAHLISHQFLSGAGGRLFYNTNLGSIVCLDPLTGRIEWLSEYTRVATERQTQRVVDRYRYRDTTPCVVAGGLVYCAPQDCPEVFALDVTTGDLVWSTDSLQVADAIHILGVEGQSLVVSGDRIVWLDRLSGKVLSRFPTSTTPGRLNALPSPRGLGRGAIADEKVFWPISGEIIVFKADQHAGESPPSAQQSAAQIPPPPKILRRISLGNRGTEGGNLIVGEDHLIVASPSSIMVFPNRLPSNE